MTAIELLWGRSGMRPYGLKSFPKYLVCRVFGHKNQLVDEPIINNKYLWIEQDMDCLRCGTKKTHVIPYVKSSRD